MGVNAAGLSRRAAGLLLHPTSLPGPHGVGDLGAEARRFADFLAESGLTWWQMLPVGPAGAGNSPYSSPSSFAGSPLLLSLHRLAEWGLLDAADLEAPEDPAPDRVDYDRAWAFKEPRLRKAYARFTREGSAELWEGFRRFCRDNAGWVDDYALYCALREASGGKPWLDWAPERKDREFRRWGPETLRSLGGAVAYHQFVQFLFDRQWAELRSHCASRGVSLIGDVPIFVALESADAWSHREVFRLDEGGRPEAVAGVPPDYFSEDGQLWGNPLYRWEALSRRGYDWWLARLRTASRRFEAVRLDHFIGFCRYWEVPAGAKTAREGAWKPGPGDEFLAAVRAGLPELELIAEDLGVVGPDVEGLRDRFGLPGMKVLQFAFGDAADSPPFSPDSIARRCVVYTGTHDNDTTAGWLARRGAGTPCGDSAWDLVRAALRSPADTAVVPVQDLLGLGSEARMNRPGVESGNWEWRLSPAALTPELSGRLRRLLEECGRLVRVAA